MINRTLKAMALLAAFSFVMQGHVGSPDIYLDGQAGPYHLFITIRPPAVIPGVSQVEIRSQIPGVREIRAVPLPLSGPGARFAPVPDLLKASPQDPQMFTGALWMMASGSWQVKISVTGEQGKGYLAVPVPSVAIYTMKMQKGLAALLSVLMTFLVFGLVAIVGAGVRESRLPAGAAPDSAGKTRGRIGMAVAFVVTVGFIWYGGAWWNSEASSYSRNVYKPLDMKTSRDGSMLTLTLSEPPWLQNASLQDLATARKVDDLIPDHEHLMHLYVIRQPGLDVIYHLHPELAHGGTFKLDLPSMPAGNYKLYADIVHENGFPETLVSSLALPQLKSRALSGDDASAEAAAWNQSPLNKNTFALPDGYRMEWIKPSQPLRAKQPISFQFRLVNPEGRAPSDMALYMGMLGHAAFVKTDGSVFAHIHPTGTVSMAVFIKAQAQSADPMAGMDMSAPHAHLPNQVGFPYGLPTAGRYRAFVQMKHGSTVETGVFDLEAN